MKWHRRQIAISILCPPNLKDFFIKPLSLSNSVPLHRGHFSSSCACFSGSSRVDSRRCSCKWMSKIESSNHSPQVSQCCLAILATRSKWNETIRIGLRTWKSLDCGLTNTMCADFESAQHPGPIRAGLLLSLFGNAISNHEQTLGYVAHGSTSSDRPTRTAKASKKETIAKEVSLTPLESPSFRAVDSSLLAEFLRFK